MPADLPIVDYAKPAQATPRRSVGELLTLSLVVTAASHAVPYWVMAQHMHRNFWGATLYGRFGADLFNLIALCFAIVLSIGTPLRSGLKLGQIRLHWKAVLVITLTQWAIVAAVYPNSPSRPFSGGPVGMWLISPAAQELVFTGFLYGLLATRWPQRVHPRVPIDIALVITAGFFAAWHLVNLRTISPGFVMFQLCYVFVLTCFSGMTRVLTGSVIYCVLIHIGVNFIAWVF